MPTQSRASLGHGMVNSFRKQGSATLCNSSYQFLQVTTLTTLITWPWSSCTSLRIMRKSPFTDDTYFNFFELNQSYHLIRQTERTKIVIQRWWACVPSGNDLVLQISMNKILLILCFCPTLTSKTVFTFQVSWVTNVMPIFKKTEALRTWKSLLTNK